MENPLDVAALRAREVQIYGNPDGPNFEQLVGEEKGRGLTEAPAYERIIQGSQSTNQEVNKEVGPPKPK